MYEISRCKLYIEQINNKVLLRGTENSIQYTILANDMKKCMYNRITLLYSRT